MSFCSQVLWIMFDFLHFAAEVPRHEHLQHMDLLQKHLMKKAAKLLTFKKNTTGSEKHIHNTKEVTIFLKCF